MSAEDIARITRPHFSTSVTFLAFWIAPDDQASSVGAMFQVGLRAGRGFAVPNSRAISARGK
jgi:hypothetical protein